MTRIAKKPPGEGGFLGNLSTAADVPRIPQTALNLQQQKPAADCARLQLLARRLHALGPKPLFSFLDERGADLRAHLEAYAELPGDFIRAYGGDKFTPPFAIKGEGTHQ
jgi:hypothetical protein